MRAETTNPRRQPEADSVQTEWGGLNMKSKHGRIHALLFNVIFLII